MVAISLSGSGEGPGAVNGRGYSTNPCPTGAHALSDTVCRAAASFKNCYVNFSTCAHENLSGTNQSTGATAHWALPAASNRRPSAP